LVGEMAGVGPRLLPPWTLPVSGSVLLSSTNAVRRISGPSISIVSEPAACDLSLSVRLSNSPGNRVSVTSQKALRTLTFSRPLIFLNLSSICQYLYLKISGIAEDVWLPYPVLFAMK
jgi:hypothetical protein